jgi:hypothetical protein
VAKMTTIKYLAVGEVDLESSGDTARIERNLFAENGDTFQALRFCKRRSGRHNRVHLVLREGAFADLFEDAVEKNVFGEETLNRMLKILARRQQKRSSTAVDPDADPFLRVIGIGEDGHLTEGIDEELYGDKPA